jgi:hypothetical protein
VRTAITDRGFLLGHKKRAIKKRAVGNAPVGEDFLRLILRHEVPSRVSDAFLYICIVQHSAAKNKGFESEFWRFFSLRNCRDSANTRKQRHASNLAQAVGRIYLTTKGHLAEAEYAMIRDLQFEVRNRRK